MPDPHLQKVIKEFSELARAMRAFIAERKTESAWLRKCHGELATKQDLRKMEKKIMSAISEFATRQTAFNDRQDTAIAALQADVTNLNEQIAALQASAGTITAEDQALLDGIETRASAISDKLDALDALTPPKVPTA